jgi:hypothetical protein
VGGFVVFCWVFQESGCFGVVFLGVGVVFCVVDVVFCVVDVVFKQTSFVVMKDVTRIPGLFLGLPVLGIRLCSKSPHLRSRCGRSV